MPFRTRTGRGPNPMSYGRYSYRGTAQGPVIDINNGPNSCYFEFSRDGYTARGSVGALGVFETNLSYNMDYKTGVHRLYDQTLPAIWIAMNETGMYLQYAPATLADGDVWNAAGRLYNWYVKNDTGNAYFRGNLGLGAGPVASARLYSNGASHDAATLGLYATDDLGAELFKQWNDGTLWNKGNVGFGHVPYPAARLTLQSATSDNTSYALYTVDATNPTIEIFYVRGDGLLLHNGDAVIGSATSEVGFYNHATTTQQLLATGAGHTVDDVIVVLQNLGLCKQL